AEHLLTLAVLRLLPYGPLLELEEAVQGLQPLLHRLGPAACPNLAVAHGEPAGEVREVDVARVRQGAARHHLLELAAGELPQTGAGRERGHRRRGGRRTPEGVERRNGRFQAVLHG